ncbi:MAG: hypothetical protein ACRED1_05530 [Limisphaerales bacterium]
MFNHDESANVTGAGEPEALRVNFDGRATLEFHRSQIVFDLPLAGHQLDEAPGRRPLPCCRRHRLSRSLLRFPLWFFMAWVLGRSCLATPNLRFDVVTFCCGCTDLIMCEPEFQPLNFPTGNGHFVAMGSDAHRAELLANGNILAIYWNDFHMDSITNGAEYAATVEQSVESLFMNTGPRPDWIVLNEISGSQWPTNQAYRAWVEDVVHALHTTYGYSVIVYSPFPTVAGNDASWQAVSAEAYIAVENYLSGQEVQAQDFSVSWCQSQYENTINTYNARGVPTSRLILGEHFGQTLAGTAWGRAGVSSNDWDSAIRARDAAALETGFAGFIGYDWGNDDMGVSTNEMIHFEDTYASDPLPSVSGITAPGIAQQPQSQTLPAGATVTFLVFPAGANALSYQWRFNGANIAGAASSSYTLANITSGLAGNYSVLLSNSVSSTLSSDAVLTVSIPPPLAAEPFAPASTNGGTAYAPGAALIGQTNAQGLAWFQAGPSTANQPLIQSGSLQVAGLAAASGNSVSFGGNGTSARFDLFTNSSSITTGTLYYSFALKLTDIGGMASGGAFWAGFNNSSGAQANTPTTVASRVYTRAAGDGFNFGISKATSTALDIVWDTTNYDSGETVFLVGSYTFNPDTTNDDVASLWVNPAPSTFGAASAPAPALTTSADADINSGAIRSFVLMNRIASEPANGIFDELRLGASWASVTPPAQPPPFLNYALDDGVLILSWHADSTGFTLQSSPTLADPTSWTPVSSPVSVVDGQYTVTVPISSALQFFRLLAQ